MAMSEAPAPRGREPTRIDETRSEPAQSTGVLGVAQNTTPQQRARQSPAADFKQPRAKLTLSPGLTHRPTDTTPALTPGCATGHPWRTLTLS